MTTINCRICGRPCPPGHHRRRRCSTCAQYHHRYGRDRTEQTIVAYGQHLIDLRLERRNRQSPH